jgi:hypothetical protein
VYNEQKLTVTNLRSKKKMTREEHVQWCKSRAYQIADEGDLAGAVASMVSDLGKHEETEEVAKMAGLLSLALMLSAPNTNQVKNWIDGFA